MDKLIKVKTRREDTMQLFVFVSGAAIDYMVRIYSVGVKPFIILLRLTNYYIYARTVKTTLI